MEKKPLMKQIINNGNITKAYKHVFSNLGSNTSSRLYDGITQREELEQWMLKNMDKVIEELFTYSYKPDPVRKIIIKKIGGGERQLGVQHCTTVLFNRLCSRLYPCYLIGNSVDLAMVTDLAGTAIKRLPRQ